MSGANEPVQRLEVTVDGVPLSYLHAGSGPPVLLVHGAFWSRVWKPVLADLARAGYEAYALDFPGFGHLAAAGSSRSSASGARCTRRVT